MTEIEKLEAEIADRNEQTAKLEKKLAELKAIQVQAKIWLATDKDGSTYVYTENPLRIEKEWYGDSGDFISSFFKLQRPKWEEEPIEVLITIQKA